MERARRLRSSTRKLSRAVEALQFGAPVTHVYNPLRYASRSHARYVDRFATNRKKVVFLGMNPGPYGMAQTGVPFGEVSFVRDWLRIKESVGRPAIEHPQRPVTGFACTRREVSGQRLWGAIAQNFGTPERFFETNYIANYCPLVFMEESGRNRTPDKLPSDEREPLFEVCDAHLRSLIDILEPTWLIGVGAFAAKRAESALAGREGRRSPQIASILHPSPANPRANRDWSGEVHQQLSALGLCKDR